MVNHFHLWLSHEGKDNKSEYLYEEIEIDDKKTAEDIIKFMNEVIMKMKRRYKIQ